VHFTGVVYLIKLDVYGSHRCYKFSPATRTIETRAAKKPNCE